MPSKGNTIIFRTLALSPLGVGKGKDRPLHVTSKRSGNVSLHEVKEVNLAVHAAGHDRVEVANIANAGDRSGMQRQGVTPVELRSLASVLETCTVVFCVLCSLLRFVWVFRKGLPTACASVARIIFERGFEKSSMMMATAITNIGDKQKKSPERCVCTEKKNTGTLLWGGRARVG